MNAILITIGDEILSGNTVDTNSNFIASELKNIGVKVNGILTIADDEQAIVSALGLATKEADLIFTTGGIGPTKDDKTKDAFCQFFDDDLILDSKTLEHLKKILIKRKREHLLEINYPQAEVLSKAIVFQNDNGTAPCQMMEHHGKMIFSLPGVPYEVKPLIKDKIIPFLSQKLALNHIITKIISVTNIPESLLSKTIEPWELALPKDVSLSYLPIGSRIKLRLTAAGKNLKEIEHLLDSEIKKLKPYISENVISWGGNDIQEILKELLEEKGFTISSAESCTGGEISKLITSISGCSKTFIGGVVAYDSAMKVKLLQVSEDTIKQNTVVSAQVAQEMSLGCQKLFATDISVSTTGVAGPNSDEYNNEVGKIFYSIRIKNFEKTNQLFLPHLERKDFMNFVSQRVLQDVVELLVNKTYIID